MSLHILPNPFHPSTRAAGSARSSVFPLICGVALTLTALLGSRGTVHAQPVLDQPDLAIDAATRNEVITEANRLLLERYVDLPLAQRMVTFVAAQQSSGAYNSISSAKTLVGKLTEDYRGVSEDLHLAVEFMFAGFPDPDELPPPPPDWEEQNRRAFGRVYNFGLVRAEILEGNIGIITLEGFPPKELMADTLSAVMKFVAYTDALIIDSRHTAGGDPAAVSQMLSYFLPARVIKTNTVYNRFENRTEEFFTTIDLLAPRYLERKVFVVVGPETFSANEEFAYDLQQFQRARLVGATTAGAANPAMFSRINAHFGISIPMGKVINPISGTNWERVGVTPEVPAADWFSVQKAYVLALESVLAEPLQPLTPDELTRLENNLEKQREILRKLSRMKHAPKKDPVQQP